MVEVRSTFIWNLCWGLLLNTCLSAVGRGLGWLKLYYNHPHIQYNKTIYFFLVVSNTQADLLALVLQKRGLYLCHFS